MNREEAIRQLEETGQYRVIRRLDSPASYTQGRPATPRTGLVIDTETTGLDTGRDKIIELGLIAFEYDAASGQIHRVLHRYGGFEDPGEPLTDIVKRITGISDEMLADQRLEDDEINQWLEKADLMIAHNAAFDRPMLERRFPAACRANWACSMNDIDWQAEDIAGLKLDYIAFRLGFFFDGHRAVNDAEATLHLLAQPLPVSGRPAMTALLSAARDSSHRLFAVAAPFDKKDELKARSYQWLSDFSYSDSYGRQKTGVWSTVVSTASLETEQQWLTEAIYQGKPGRFATKEITARERYSLREFGGD